MKLQRTWLTELRERAGLSQAKLAEILDIKRQTVTAWESGTNKPGHDHLFGLKRLLGPEVIARFDAEAEAAGEPTQQAS